MNMMGIDQVIACGSVIASIRGAKRIFSAPQCLRTRVWCGRSMMNTHNRLDIHQNFHKITKATEHEREEDSKRLQPKLCDVFPDGTEDADHSPQQILL